MAVTDAPSSQQLFHGTKADLKPRDLIEAGRTRPSIAERLRGAVRALALPHGSSPVAPVATISVGVASAVPEEGQLAADLLAVADRALYHAKRSGRDRVEHQPAAA